jgi:hypothetical protein
VSTPTEHADFVSRLSDEAEEDGLLLYSHEYDYLAFGSWTIVIGTSKRRLRFCWDGKESSLNIEMSQFQNSNSAPSWEAVSSSFDASEATDQELEALILQRLDAELAT